MQIIDDHQAPLGLVLPHGPPCLGAHLRHRELAAAFHHRQARGHRLPGFGGRPQLRQVGIAALHVTGVDAGAGAQQLQRQVRGGVLEGDHDDGHVFRRRRRDLQRQRGFAHAGRTRQQVEAVVEPAQQVIELYQSGGHAQYGPTCGLTLKATGLSVGEHRGQ